MRSSLRDAPAKISEIRGSRLQLHASDPGHVCLRPKQIFILVLTQSRWRNETTRVGGREQYENPLLDTLDTTRPMTAHSRLQLPPTMQHCQS